MPKKKRKLSAYNRFVRTQVKAGRSFSQAARAWKGGRKVTLKTRKRAVKRKVKPMARRRARRAFSRARRAYSSPNRLMRGMLPVGGVIGKVVTGVGVATLQEKFLPQVIPYQSVAAGFIVGGLPGAAGAFAKSMLVGNGAAIGSGGVY